MNDQQRQTIVDLLRTAYNMEIETIANYLANSIHLDGFKAKHIKDALAADIQEELLHATQIAKRIKVLEGRVPGSQELKMGQTSLQPPADQLDILAVVRGVIDAEDGAVKHYQAIIEAAEGVDPVTQDLCVALKGDEEEHRREFKGFLAEIQAG